MRWPVILITTAGCLSAHAQQPIAYAPTEGVTLSGSLEVANGRATIGNNGTITAGTRTASIDLTRGGKLNVCASTRIHLSTDKTSADAGAAGALMIALDRGALEASYTPGKFSDVLMTPDLRILISGPGKADLKIRVNQKGDTCIDNHGADAPYVTATNLFEGGAYRIQPNQRVLFEHGSLQQVVDNEQESCGCPPPLPLSVASAGTPGGGNAARPGEQVGGPSSTPADTAFPLAESEGLAPTPAPSTTPAVPAGETHTQVSVPLTFNGDASRIPTEPPPPPENPAVQALVGTPQPALSAKLAEHAAVTEAPPTPPANLPAKRIEQSASVPTPVPRPSSVKKKPAKTVPAQTTPSILETKPPAKTAAASAPAVQTQTTAHEALPPKPTPEGGFLHRVSQFFSSLFGR